MSSFRIQVNYTINGDDDNAVVRMTSAMLTPDTGGVAIDDKNKTAVFANGDINIDKGDTADITFALDNVDDWRLTLVQIKGKNKSDFGGSLDSDESADFPGFDANNGSYSPGAQKTSAKIQDDNSKAKDIDYRVQFTNTSTNAIVYSDPRIRDSGGLN